MEARGAAFEGYCNSWSTENACASSCTKLTLVFFGPSNLTVPWDAHRDFNLVSTPG